MKRNKTSILLYEHKDYQIKSKLQHTFSKNKRWRKCIKMSSISQGETLSTTSKDKQSIKNRKTNRNEMTHTSKQTHRHIHPSRQTDTYIQADTQTHTSKQTHRHIHPSRHIQLSRHIDTYSQADPQTQKSKQTNSTHTNKSGSSRVTFTINQLSLPIFWM